jgi:hypothetical protein
MLVPQVLRKQTERDASVKELAEAMVNLFSWVKETEGWNHKLERFRKTIEMMAQQATECALFIKDYANRGFLGALGAYRFAEPEQYLMFDATFSIIYASH